MRAARQDSWSPEDDLILAETVLRHIREGSTQLMAFEEVGERLTRTAAACGFRWNATVRKQYKEAIVIAKQRKMESKNSRQTPSRGQAVFVSGNAEAGYLESHSVEDMIRFLNQQKRKLKALRQLERELELKDREIEMLRSRVGQLEGELDVARKEHSQVSNDYKTLIKIMERARKAAFLQEDGRDIVATETESIERIG